MNTYIIPYSQTTTNPIGIIVAIAYLKDLKIIKIIKNDPPAAIGIDLLIASVDAFNWSFLLKGDPVTPTFIFLMHDKEVGRIVERPLISLEADLNNIFKRLKTYE